LPGRQWRLRDLRLAQAVQRQVDQRRLRRHTPSAACTHRASC
jgi:hypothetical protein